MVQVQIKSDSQDTEIVKKLVQNAIESEIKNLQRSLKKTNQLLIEFEQKYQVTSDYFLHYYTAEDMEGGDDEYISWLGEIKIKEKLINSLEQLEKIEYVT